MWIQRLVNKSAKNAWRTEEVKNESGDDERKKVLRNIKQGRSVRGGRNRSLTLHSKCQPQDHSSLFPRATQEIDTTRWLQNLN